MKLNGAQIIIEQLISHGVTHVFGYPGGAVLTLYDELYKNSSRIKHILTAHEQGAAHAADGYARTSGKTGVVITTSGPGATNLVTGIANAYLDSIPLVAITGNVDVSLLGRDSFQEVDIIGITQPVVKHSFIVREAAELEYTISQAFRIAESGRRGPVLIDVPKNVQNEICEYYGIKPSINKNEQSNQFNIGEIITDIKNSKCPYIYAGGGVIASGAEEELLAFSQRISAPVGLSMMGLTALSADYTLNLGMSGMHGGYAVSAVLTECDLLIALGVRFSDRATGNTDVFSKNKKIIHVDIDHAEHGKNITNVTEVSDDIKEFLNCLLAEIPFIKNEAWLKRIEELKAEQEEKLEEDLTPKNIIKAVNRRFGGNTVVATDVGQHQIWVAQNYKFQKPRTLLTSGGLGAMGFGLGAAIGGCIAKNKQKTVLFTGDGSFGMNLNELATAVSQKLPIVIIIFNNNALGLPRQWQSMFYGERYSQSILNRKTDFAAVARAFGAEGHSVATMDKLEEALENLPDNIPLVIDCLIYTYKEVYPMNYPDKIKGE